MLIHCLNWDCPLMASQVSVCGFWVLFMFTNTDWAGLGQMNKTYEFFSRPSILIGRLKW